ncbi:hypothetical protein CFP56_037296 [Quercus suber]|uniref:Uncharacterized protein n=1 Tax=Quercus suber TaxID=58331 RepID=A0AAW0J4T0_QUESU
MSCLIAVRQYLCSSGDLPTPRCHTEWIFLPQRFRYRADATGSSMYMYFRNKDLGKITNPRKTGPVKGLRHNKKEEKRRPIRKVLPFGPRTSPKIQKEGVFDYKQKLILRKGPGPILPLFTISFQPFLFIPSASASTVEHSIKDSLECGRSCKAKGAAIVGEVLAMRPRESEVFDYGSYVGRKPILLVAGVKIRRGKLSEVAFECRYGCFCGSAKSKPEALLAVSRRGLIFPLCLF